MIHPDDLRRGNWVLVKGKRTKLDYAIGDECALYTHMTEIKSALYEDMMPIPLTEKVLWKLGLELDEDNSYRFDDNRVSIRYYHKIKTLEVFFNENIKCSPRVAHEYVVKLPCSYLHEYQNIMKDCKIDFEFSL